MVNYKSQKAVELCGYAVLRRLEPDDEPIGFKRKNY